MDIPHDTEARAILALARGDTEALANGGAPDWERVLERARAHQVDALVYRRLHDRRPSDSLAPGSPPSFDEGLKLAYWRHALRNELLLEQLAALQRELRRAGVESLAFKGPWLAWRAYPDPGCRPIDDIDLGVRERDYEAALPVLTRLGYGPVAPLPATGEEALRVAHSRRQLRFTAQRGRPLELHFRLVNVGPPSPDERWVWDGAEALEVDGHELRVPGPTAMLLHVLLHANQHGFAVLRLLHDVACAITALAGQLDHDGLVARIEEHRFRASAYYGLLLARDLAGADVPAELLQRLRPGPLRRRWFARAWSLPRVRALEAPRRASRWEAPRLYLLEMGSLTDKVRYLRSLVGGGR